MKARCEEGHAFRDEDDAECGWCFECYQIGKAERVAAREKPCPHYTGKPPRKCVACREQERTKREELGAVAWKLFEADRRAAIRKALLADLADWDSAEELATLQAIEERVAALRTQPTCLACGAVDGKLPPVPRPTTDDERNQGRAQRMGVSVEAIEALILRSGGRCEACAVALTNKQMRVDHCHDTGQVRGVLCNGCNVLEGRIKARLKVEAVLKYLERFG